MKRLTLALAACCVLALVAGRTAAADPVTPNELKQIGIAYHNHIDATGKPPAKPDDLLKYLDNNQKLVDKMKEGGDIVFVFGVGITDMKEGTSNTVLAYPKDVEKNGGPVLYGDGSVKKLTADEFKKATIAKPKNK